MTKKTPVCRHGVYKISNEVEASVIFHTDPRLQRYAIPTPWVTHWNRNYSLDIGVIRIGYTVIRNIALVKPSEHGKPEAELLIQCEEGYLGREEAIGTDWIPTPSEIEEAARAIREANDAAGTIRKAETVGFELQRVYRRPMVVFH